MQTNTQTPFPMLGHSALVPPLSLRWIVGCLAVFVVLLVLRNPYMFLYPQFWHEDMIVFFQQPRELGLAAIITPYAGYLHLYQRLSALATSLFPIEFTPLLYTLAALAGWIWVATLTLTSSVFLDRRWAFGATLALLLVPSYGEIYLILTNIQWVFGATLALLLVERTPTKLPWPKILFACVAGLTGPFSFMLAPVALLKGVITYRSLRKIDYVALSVLLTAALQLALVLTSSGRIQQAANIDHGKLALGFSLGVFPEMFGTFLTFPEDTWLRLTGSIVGFIGAVWACGSHLAGANTRRFLIMGGVLVLSAGMVSCFSVYGGAPRAFGNGSRYLFIPFVIYTWCLIDAWSRAPRRPIHQSIPIVLLFALLIHSAEKPLAPRQRIVEWALICRDLRRGNTVYFQIPPHAAWITLSPLPTD